MIVLTEILELIKNQAIPCIIEIAELMGVFIVAVSLVKAMYYYVRSTFFHQPHSYLFELGSGLSTALEFKMAAEILKTVLATTLEELLLVAAVFGLRALMSLLLHYELHGQENHPGKLDADGNKHEAQEKE
jgi:uncharacterized membrane protein